MGLKCIHKENFYCNLFEKNTVSSNCKSINTTHDNKLIFINKNIPSNNIELAILSLVPSYLQISTTTVSKPEKVFHKHGYAVNLEGIISVDNYIKNNCTTNFKKNVIRCLNRLESCFNIKYQMFYGNINKDDYNLLMNALHEMIMKRFQQRLGRNKVLKDWQDYTKKTFSLINNKQASLFAIYNENEPIEISLNFHFNNILYSSISSFNVDYSKFSLGNIEIYKQLEWCLENNIKIFDMGYGDLDYKKSWSNTRYNFESYIITSSTLIAKACAQFLKLKYKAIDYLISKKLNDTYYSAIGFLKKDPQKTLNIQPKYEIEIVDRTTIKTLEKKDVLQELNSNLSFLKRPIYDFMYSNNENFKNITVYKLKDIENTYIVSGIKNDLKVTVSIA